MNKAEKLKSVAGTRKGEIEWSTRASIWWLRHFEEITHFWTGFSWVVVIGTFLTVIVGLISFNQAVIFVLIFGFVGNMTLYFVIRTIAVCLRHIEPGPEKEEAHELMTAIIRRRLLR